MPSLTPYDRHLLAQAKIVVDDWPEAPRADGLFSVSRSWFDAKCAETRELRIEIDRLRELAGMWKDAALMAIIGAVIWAVLWACK